MVRPILIILIYRLCWLLYYKYSSNAEDSPNFSIHFIQHLSNHKQYNRTERFQHSTEPVQLTNARVTSPTNSYTATIHEPSTAFSEPFKRPKPTPFHTKAHPFPRQSPPQNETTAQIPVYFRPELRNRPLSANDGAHAYAHAKQSTSGSPAPRPPRPRRVARGDVTSHS